MSQKFSLLYFFGRPFSPLYTAAMKAREFLYLKGLKKQHKIDVPVISVGNLTMGGTGKTPIVSSIALIMQEKGYKPAIVSRGYGGNAGNKVNVVSDGSEVFLTAAEAGDEPRFLAERLPGIQILTGVVRILPCRHAVEKAGCDLIILDDGFQHLAVKRDIDFVLFSAASLAGNSRVFPGGDLREPVSALKRCDAFIITGVTNSLRERTEKFKTLLSERFQDTPVFFSSYTATQAVEADGTEHELQNLPTPLFAFCGIGQPPLFEQSLSDGELRLSGFMPLKDHQRYTPSLVKKINSQAVASGAQAIITTEKDLVKIRDKQFDLPLFSLQMEARPDRECVDFIHSRLASPTR